MAEKIATAEQRYAARLRQLREAAGMSTRDVEREMDLRGFAGFESGRCVAKIETGRRKLQIAEAEVLLGVLGAHWVDLFDHSGGYDRDLSKSDDRALRQYRLGLQAAGDAVGPLTSAAAAFVTAVRHADKARVKMDFEIDDDDELAQITHDAAAELIDVLRLLPADQLQALGQQFQSSRRRRSR